MSNIIEEVRIPLIWDPPPVSCRLVNWLVSDGQHVHPCHGIFILEINDQLIEVESFYSGHMKQLIPAGTICNVGDIIAKIILDEVDPELRVIPLYLSGSEISDLDLIRKDTPREYVVRDMILRAIAEHKIQSEQAAPSNP